MALKIATILGTRPEAIKLAPVILALRARPEFECRLCATAQHRQLLDQVLDVFDLAPDADLDLMRPGQTLNAFAARALEALDGYLAREQPDWILVQGDTSTVFCATLAAFYRHIPVGHVEAGLRTGDLSSPWPEEANRVLTTRLALLHFAPTESAKENLLKEGVPAARVLVTGNTGIDALFLALERIRTRPPEIPGLPAEILASDAPLVLITGHRRENFGTRFEVICKAIAELARRFPEAHFAYPVHLNPQVREPVERLLGQAGDAAQNIHLLEPLTYLPFVALMQRARVILTDSGGIQEEAPSLGKPVLVMRDTTERPEAVAAGTAKLVGADFTAIVEETARLLREPETYAAASRIHNPYGDGRAAERIVDCLLKRARK